MLYYCTHRYAVEKINHNQEVLAGTRLSAQIEWIPPGDSFHASRRGNPSMLPGEVILPASRRGNLSSFQER
jgi:hypothetical protein